MPNGFPASPADTYQPLNIGAQSAERFVKVLSYFGKPQQPIPISQAQQMIDSSTADVVSRRGKSIRAIRLRVAPGKPIEELIPAAEATEGWKKARTTRPIAGYKFTFKNAHHCTEFKTLYSKEGRVISRQQ